MNIPENPFVYLKFQWHLKGTATLKALRADGTPLILKVINEDDKKILVKMATAIECQIDELKMALENEKH